MNSLLIPIIRTGVPYAVGLAVTWLATIGITVSDDMHGQLISVGTFLVGTLYYVAVKWLEKKWPKLGIFLGVPIAPVYGATAQTEEPTDEDPDPNLDSGVPPGQNTEAGD